MRLALGALLSAHWPITAWASEAVIVSDWLETLEAHNRAHALGAVRHGAVVEDQLCHMEL